MDDGGIAGNRFCLMQLGNSEPELSLKFQMICDANHIFDAEKGRFLKQIAWNLQLIQVGQSVATGHAYKSKRSLGSSDHF